MSKRNQHEKVLDNCLNRNEREIFAIEIKIENKKYINNIS